MTKRTTTTLARFSNLIQPVLLIVMGVVIAFLLLSLYMPLFNLSIAEELTMANQTSTPPPPEALYIEPEHAPVDHAAEEVRARFLASRYQLEFVDLEHFHPDHELFRSIPADVMLRLRLRAVPARRARRCSIVVSDPSDICRRSTKSACSSRRRFACASARRRRFSRS